MIKYALVAIACAAIQGAAAQGIQGCSASTPVLTVGVGNPHGVVKVGGTTKLTALVADGRGHVYNDCPASWNSSDERIATVSTTGLVTGKAIGSATISATYKGKKGLGGVVVRQSVAAKGSRLRDRRVRTGYFVADVGQREWRSRARRVAHASDTCSTPSYSDFFQQMLKIYVSSKGDSANKGLTKRADDVITRMVGSLLRTCGNYTDRIVAGEDPFEAKTVGDALGLLVVKNTADYKALQRELPRFREWVSHMKEY
jgi:hypothetical protein